MTILKDRVAELGPAYVPVDSVSRTVYRPGEQAQCDLWFPEADIPLGYGQSGRMPVLVMVSGYSRGGQGQQVDHAGIPQLLRRRENPRRDPLQAGPVRRRPRLRPCRSPDGDEAMCAWSDATTYAAVRIVHLTTLADAAQTTLTLRNSAMH